MIKKDVKVGDEVFFKPTARHKKMYLKEEAYYTIEEVGRKFFYFDGGKKKCNIHGSDNIVYSVPYSNVIGTLHKSEAALLNNDQLNERFNELKYRISQIKYAPIHFNEDKLNQIVNILNLDPF